MAVTNYRALQALTAATDLSKGYGLGVVINASGDAALPAAGKPIVGTIIETAPQGETLGVCCEQGVKSAARVSAAVTAGAALSVGADGRFATAATGSAIVGYALEAATAANQIITFMQTPGGAAA